MWPCQGVHFFNAGQHSWSAADTVAACVSRRSALPWNAATTSAVADNVAACACLQDCPALTQGQHQLPVVLQTLRQRVWNWVQGQRQVWRYRLSMMPRVKAQNWCGTSLVTCIARCLSQACCLHTVAGEPLTTFQVLAHCVLQGCIQHLTAF